MPRIFAGLFIGDSSKLQTYNYLMSAEIRMPVELSAKISKRVQIIAQQETEVTVHLTTANGMKTSTFSAFGSLETSQHAFLNYLAEGGQLLLKGGQLLLEGG